MSNQSLSPKALKALKFIRNSILHRGFPPTVQEVADELDYGSTNSAAYIIDKLSERGLIKKTNGKIQLKSSYSKTVSVPLVGSAPCGDPFLAEENIEAYIQVSKQLARPPHKYFFLNAVGDSMDKKGINDGDLVLVKQQSAADNGDAVIALIDDEATIKEFYHDNNTVVLKPKSTNKEHKPIIMTDDFQIQGVVIKAIPNPQ